MKAIEKVVFAVLLGALLLTISSCYIRQTTTGCKERKGMIGYESKVKYK